MRRRWRSVGVRASGWWRSVGSGASRVSVRRRCVRTPRLSGIRVGIVAIVVILARVVVGILGSLFGVVIGSSCRRAIATAVVSSGSRVALSGWRRRRFLLFHFGSTLTVFRGRITVRVVTSSRSFRRRVVFVASFILDLGDGFGDSWC
jgi:hypothetical protein